MSATQMTPEQLSAYVDGELTAAEAAEVARAMADDSNIAEKVAQLSRLKAVLPGALEPSSESLPKLPAAVRPFGMTALAAAVVLLVVAGGGLLLGPWTAPVPPAELAQAWRLHEDWASGKAAVAAPDAGTVLAARALLGLAALPPDLTSAKLTLERTVLHDSGPGAPLLHAGYSGTRGCRVSYFVLSAAEGLPAEFTALGEGAARAYGWRVGGLGFLLLAEGMDQGRFALIAKSLYAASLKLAPLDETTRTALARSRAESAPCRA